MNAKIYSPKEEAVYLYPECVMILTKVMPQTPDKIKTVKVTIIIIEVSRNNLCLNLLCEAN